jgi:Flp pilus assembly pilin Flp
LPVARRAPYPPLPFAAVAKALFRSVALEASARCPQMTDVFSSIWSFVTKDDGSQVLEYALLIAVLSVALILLLRPLADDVTTSPCV